MAHEIKDINKSLSDACLNCRYVTNCPYNDKSQCINVRSSGWDAEIDRNDIQESDNEGLWEQNDQ